MRRTLSLASDTFSLGALLFEVLLLKPLFVGDTLHHILVRDLEKPLSQVNLETVAGLDPAQKLFLAKALMAEPEDRFQTAEEFCLGLHIAMDDPNLQEPGTAALWAQPDGTTEAALLGISQDIWGEQTMTTPEFQSTGGNRGYVAAGIIALLIALGVTAWVLLGPSPDAIPGGDHDSGTRSDTRQHSASAEELTDWHHPNDTGSRAAQPDLLVQEQRLVEPADAVAAVEVARFSDASAPDLAPAQDELRSEPVASDISPPHTDMALHDSVGPRVDVASRGEVRRAEVRRATQDAKDHRHHGHAARQPSPPAEKPAPATSPQPVLFEVMVDSIQADVIVLEGSRLLGRTPLSVTVLGNRPRKVILRKQGYLDHELTLTGAQSSHRVELQMAMW